MKRNNLQEMPLKDIVETDLYITAFVFYYHKFSLIFYNDEQKMFPDIIVEQQKIRKSRRQFD